MKIKNLLLSFVAIVVGISGVQSFLVLARAQAEEVALFSDIASYQWQSSIEYIKQEDIVSGYSDGRFQPEAQISRAEFTKIVMESFFDTTDLLYEESCFSDTSVETWIAPYACLAKEFEIIRGYEDGTFQPDSLIRQSEALKILLNAAFEEPLEFEEGDWEQAFFEEAEYLGMLYFSAQDDSSSHLLTRGEMAYFVAWLLDESAQDQINIAEFYGEEQEDGLTTYEDEENIVFDASGNENHTSSEQSLAVYVVDQNHIRYESGKYSAKHKVVWDVFVSLIPQEMRTSIKEFHIFEGDDGTSAYVQPLDDEDVSSWLLAVNIADESFDAKGDIINMRELQSTLVHEFAHVMTLNDSQIDNTLAEDDCYPRFHAGEGCALPVSYINLYVKQFWQAAAVKMARESEQDFEGYGSVMYEKTPDNFVNKYASTNPGEDIAETFMHFVFEKKPSDTSQVKQQKILFFHTFSELVQLRQSIRSTMQSPMNSQTNILTSDRILLVLAAPSMTQKESREVQSQFQLFADSYGIERASTEYMIDGGSIVDNYAGKAIATTRFLEDNDLTCAEGKAVLRELLNLDEVAIIEPDEAGLAHSDGMVSWIEDDA